jgi:peptidoglycan/LPS O-acetylase OafA/YrhL
MLFWLLRRSTRIVGLLAVVVWLTLTLVTWHFGALSWLTWTANGGVIRAIPSFSLGVWIFGSRQWIGRLPHAHSGFWLGVVAFLCGCCAEIPEPLLLIVLYITVALAVAADSKRRQGGLLRMLAAGGQLTYSSYMLQELVVVVFLSSAADHVLHLHGSSKNIMVLFAFVLIWVVSYLSLIFFERPARRWLGRLDSQRHAMAA